MEKVEQRAEALERALRGVTSTSRGYLCWCDNSWNAVEHGHQPKCQAATAALSSPSAGPDATTGEKL